MQIGGMLNSEIAKVLADLGHTDQIVIADCGLPIPEGVKKIDLAITFGVPSFQLVLQEILRCMKVESCILAKEIEDKNPDMWTAIREKMPQTPMEFVMHEEFKELTKSAKVIIRTGEASPYANIILQSGCIFG